MTNHHETRSVNVVTQNVLHDVTRMQNGLILPQGLRVNSISEALKLVSGSLDVVGIQEAHESLAQHNGEVLADLVGYGPGVWARHNQKLHEHSKRGRTGELIGLFGALVEEAHEVDLGDQRKGLITVIGGVAFATCHWRAGFSLRSAYVRRLNAVRLANALDEYDNAVILGDLNEPDIPVFALGRTVLARCGFESVFSLTGQNQPATFPTPAYSQVYDTCRQFGLDDILVKGNVRVIDAGTVQPVVEQRPLPQASVSAPHDPLDHYGVWASLEI